MKKSKEKSALKESGSRPGKANINPNSATQIKNFRKERSSEKQLLEDLLKGDKTALGRSLTFIESRQQSHLQKAQFLVEGALPHAHKSMRIGITGVPGVGKSTFIEALGGYLIQQGKKVAVLAVDPTSTVSKGSILGDKTRMEDLVKEENAFIRPSPSGDSLGGVAQKTRESIILCEAAGFDVLLIETVGVGQSETTVHSMTDFFLLLKLAGAGDELQGIKRGIMEMADAIVINKADGDNKKPARNAAQEFKRALHLYPPKESQWKPKVLLASAFYKQGIAEVWELIENFKKEGLQNGYFQHNRNEQKKYWLLQSINEHLKNRFYQNPIIKTELEKHLRNIEANKITTYAAAKKLLKKYENL